MKSAIFGLILKASIRDRLILSLVLCLLVATSLSIFLGGGAPIEKETFSIVLAAGSIRFVGILGLVLFAAFFVRRCFDAREIEYLIARPVSRAGLVFSYSFTFSMIAVFVALIQGVLILFIRRDLGDPGFMLWSASIAVENVVMVNVALFFSMTLSSAAASSMSSLGFYVLTRLMGEILGILDRGPHLAIDRILSCIMKPISMLMPRLDLMGQTSWLVYGLPEKQDLFILCSQPFVFIFLIVMASVFDFQRRQF